MKIAMLLAVLILSACSNVAYGPPPPGMLENQQAQLQAQMRYNQERNDYMAQQYLQPRRAVICNSFPGQVQCF